MNTAIQKKARSPWRMLGMPQTGLVVDVSVDGSPTVEYSGNALGAIRARTIISSARRGDTVLLIFDEGDPTRPIIENDAVIPYWRRIRRTCGVYTGLGPSSMVSATTFGPSRMVCMAWP